MLSFFKSILMSVVVGCIIFLGQGTASGQIGFIPMPPPPVQPNPCVALQQQVGMMTAGLNCWRAILGERRTSLANAQARLAEVESWRELFWDGVDQQTAPLSDGQIMAIGMINMAIMESKTHVAQMQIQVFQAEQQEQAWSTLVRNAQAALTAAGC